MRIISTVKKFFPFIFLFLVLVPGCTQKSDFKAPQDYAQAAQDYYQRAVNTYRELISKNKDLDKLYFALGKLYYTHGDFELAEEAFKKSDSPQAKKFLAIAYYRSANFTDALEVFNKQESGDDEYLYYQGLTCEKLNLFEQAIKSYQKIKEAKFKALAKERMDTIEKQAHAAIAPGIRKILASAPPQESYPQAGALILLCDENIEVSSAGSQASSLHYLVKILNERGKEDFSETHIEYDSTYEKVELEYARTIKPDGTVAEVGSRHIRDVSKYLNFPLYSNARVYIISFPEIVQGAAIEYKLKVYRSQLINKKDFVLGYPVQASEPVIAANFSVTLPKEKTLRVKILNEKYNDFAAKLQPQIQEKEGKLIYRWQFKDIPQIIPEANMPPQVQINPAILLSTFGKWEDIYNWWWPLASDKINADSAIKQKVKELIRGKNSDEGKARAIYNFCAKEIRYVAVEYGEAGYEPHRAGDIFRNKYGDCKDQAILLVAMLKDAGLAAWPLLIATKEYYNLNVDFPALLFNHCIAAVALKNGIYFLDPTAETCSFGDLPAGDQGRKVLIIKESGYLISDTPLYPAGHNLARQEVKIKVNPDETINAEKIVFTYGLYDQVERYWLLYTPPQLIEEALKEKIQDVSIGAKLKDYNIENLTDLNQPVVLNYSFIGPEYFTEAGILRIMPGLAGIDTSLVAKDKRRYPIDFGIPDTKETIFEMEIPGNFLIKYIPESVQEESPWINFSAEYRQKNHLLYFRQKAEIKKSEVSESEYPEFKKFFTGLAKKLKQRVVLERVK